MREHYRRSDLEKNGVWREKERAEAAVERRMVMTDEALADEDRHRLRVSRLKFPPVHSLEVFFERYGSFVWGLMRKFGAWSYHRQEDRWGDLLLRATETNHLRRYLPLLVRQMPSEPPPRRPNEKDAAYAKKLKVFEVIPPAIRGMFRVCRPTFQTHLYTLTQSVCVNGGNKERREPSSGGISIDYSTDDDDSRGSLVDVLAQVMPKGITAVDLGEILDEFECFLVSKYLTRKSKAGDLVDWWGPDIPMTRPYLHSEETSAIEVQDKIELVYGVKGRLVPKMEGVPVRDSEGKMQYVPTGEVIHRSYAQVFKLLREGYRQTDIARILKVSTGSPGNWMAQIRADFKVFMENRGVTETVLLGV